MRQIISKAILVFIVLALALYAMVPPEKKLKLGKDLRGGATLIYQVKLRPDENPSEVLPKVIEVLKQRVDPNGLAEISMVAQGRDRIEITMPLPGPEVKAAGEAFERELSKLDRLAISDRDLEFALRAEGAERQKQLESLAKGDAARLALLTDLAAARDNARAKNEEYKAAVKAGEKPEVLSRLVEAAGLAADEADKKKAEVLRGSLTSAEVRRVLQLPDERQRLQGQGDQFVEIPSPREKNVERLKAEHPGAKAPLEDVLRAFSTYNEARKGKGINDPQDLVRQLRGAGVLNFRITVGTDFDPATVAQLRQQLKERGPKAVRSTDVHWYKVNQIKNWYDSVDALQRLEANPMAFFQSRGYIAGEYEGEYYILCWDTRQTRLTQDEGTWSVERAYEGRDRVGRPSIAFEMDARGGVLLGELTSRNVQKQMAVIFDDEVYTAPTLQSAISRNGEISGNFSQEEIDYIKRVLNAGALQAKLSPEPISTSSVGPDLGADNLEKGMKSGIVAFSIVAAFMVVYYFGCGVIAVLALACTGVLILGAMALNKAAFTMPGIAGVVLTFGQAVDANVLIYERMREELKRGHDMKTAVRVGFQRAMPSIVDANVSHLIICIVLYQLGTQEIRGFAITLGIGVVATLFSAIVVSRLMFDALVEMGHWRKTTMLPIVVPFLQRMLEPRINWIGLRPVFLTASAIVMAIALGLVYVRGSETFDTEFRGGTQVTLELRRDPAAEGGRFTMTRRAVEERIREIKGDPRDLELTMVKDAEVLPINPRNDGVTSDKFKIKCTATDPKVVLSAVRNAFKDEIDSEPELSFKGSDFTKLEGAPVYRIAGDRLGEVIGSMGGDEDVRRFQGGVAIVLEDIRPPISLSDLTDRITRERRDAQFSDTLERQWEVRVLKGSPDAVQSAVVLTLDPSLTFLDNESIFDRNVALREWMLVQEATLHAKSFASVESFSAAVAGTFARKAITATAVSLLLLICYIWVRYGTLRWSLAAVLPLVHDIIALLGLLALSQILHVYPATQGPALSLGILPFRIDLNMVAALLMIIGFSLNDKVIILDRIRENRGREKYATGRVINDSINQTISRTLITSGTTLITTIILYLFGGEGVRGFAYAFTLGVIIGTYSSIAIAAPLVWSRRTERRIGGVGGAGGAGGLMSVPAQGVPALSEA